jgi:hypothetical protein
MEEQDKYWFPAKRYGWGWGPPTTWQGWVVLVGYVSAAILVSAFLSPTEHPLLYPILLVFLTCVLLAFLLKKGEPPSWRWGGK